MPTTKTRINLSLPTDMEGILALLAKRDAVPRATKAVELMRLAMEIEEDIVLNSIAASRDTDKAKFISHEEAWS